MSERLRRLLEPGRFVVRVVDRTYPLEEIVETHRYVETGRKVGIVVITAVPARPGSVLASGELAGAGHRRLDRVEERGPDACRLELADRGDGRAAR